MIDYWPAATGLMAIAVLIVYFIPESRKFVPDSTCQVPVCVSDSGWHTNIIVPVETPGWNWRSKLPLSPLEQPAASPLRYLAFGWGDRTFYRQPPRRPDLFITQGFAALFLPTPAVLRVQGYAQLPPIQALKCTQVSRREYLRLSQFIVNTLEWDAAGQTISLGRWAGAGTEFLAAKGSYSILNNSNNWTAIGLSKASITTPRWSTLSAAVMLHFDHPCGTNKRLSANPRNARADELFVFGSALFWSPARLPPPDGLCPESPPDPRL
uniref:Uncharacterized protein n=1 Tax=Cyanothece sp. (strain PCC 7425 / ATCC 29141) TaxID=395961 RepID=B8HW98_CYAP4